MVGSKGFNMDDVLKIIDSAIKRLVSPVAMLVAAALLLRGMNNPGSSELTIIFISSVLVLWALAFTVISTVVAVREFDSVGVSKPVAYFLSSSFVLVYFVMFVAAIRLGFDKIT